MNERLRQFERESGLEIYGLGASRDKWEAVMTKFAELVREDAFGLPTIEDASQNWEKLDGAVAWHLIERHAENWADVAKMMDEYVAAKMGVK